jgi:hypothetical protein
MRDTGILQLSLVVRELALFLQSYLADTSPQRHQSGRVLLPSILGHPIGDEPRTVLVRSAWRNVEVWLVCVTERKARSLSFMRLGPH